jgi:hypothetical protein
MPYIINGGGELENRSNFNKLIIHPAFNETIKEITKINVSLPPIKSEVQLGFQNYTFPPNGSLITPAEEIAAYELNKQNGEKIAKGFRPIAAYDESINKFVGLEGSSFLTSHSLVIMGENDFIPKCLITLYFYTRSKDIISKSPHAKFSDDPEMDSQKDYIKDKINFLVENAPEKSLLFIDGPLIGGDVYTFMIRAINKFLDKDIIPVFFVKNTSSNLVTDNTPQLKNKFNSDLHWAYKFLKSGQRTNFFQYADRNNIKNSKTFCYFKSFNVSPQRVEFHHDTYEKYKDMIPSIMDLIHYFVIAHGQKNPQVRPISIAEKFARDTLGMFDLNKLMKEVGIIPTMNQERFAW